MPLILFFCLQARSTVQGHCTELNGFFPDLDNFCNKGFAGMEGNHKKDDNFVGFQYTLGMSLFQNGMWDKVAGSKAFLLEESQHNIRVHADVSFTF
jgi:hypothetical protein